MSSETSHGRYRSRRCGNRRCSRRSHGAVPEEAQLDVIRDTHLREDDAVGIRFVRRASDGSPTQCAGGRPGISPLLEPNLVIRSRGSRGGLLVPAEHRLSGRDGCIQSGRSCHRHGSHSARDRGAETAPLESDLHLDAPRILRKEGMAGRGVRRARDCRPTAGGRPIVASESVAELVIGLGARRRRLLVP